MRRIVARVDSRTRSRAAIRDSLLAMRESYGRYRIDRKLGEGGMGVVYAARDENLARMVAIKTIREGAEPRARERLQREARLAASVNHPNVCQVFEVGEEDGELYIAMELLEGDSLAARIAAGPVALAESIGIAREILAALGALHVRGIVHRDLKPSNVFLTPHGVKLLDFGLARTHALDLTATAMDVTQPGTLVGTPRYMAPEQWAGAALGPASDLFAAGALLFEMVSGQPAFTGASVIEIHNAITKERPPSLAGGAAVAAVDRVVQRALARRPEERHATADAMAHDLAEALPLIDGGEAPRVRSVKRLIVLPFRMLRADPEVDFLAFSLADAITVSLSGLESLVVRSSLGAAKFAGESPDIKRIAVDAEVDAVLCGTLLRAGDQIRVTTQLVEAPAGTLIASKTAQASIADIFTLQDDLAREIVDVMAIPLTARERRSLHQDAPANPRAYEFYLRANQVAYNSRRLADARDLYEACLREDPRYAPAWARLGRVCRVMAKWGHGDADENFRRAEHAFEKALALDPDLAMAHNLYTYFEVEELGRSRESMVRLLERLRRGAADAEMYAGLVLACRFSGLLEASLAADARARQLDPGVRTSVAYSHFLVGDYERAMLADDNDMRWIYNVSLCNLGREEEALRRCREMERSQLPGLERSILAVFRAGFEANREECMAALREVSASRFRDPEGFLMHAHALAHTGEVDEVIEMLDYVVQRGYYCPRFLATDPWLEHVRADARFAAILSAAEAGQRAAAEAYTRAGGESLLGAPAR
ncbi:MAG: protein kinase domain-containing protein [bacterium]